MDPGTFGTVALMQVKPPDMVSSGNSNYSLAHNECIPPKLKPKMQHLFHQQAKVSKRKKALSSLDFVLEPRGLMSYLKRDLNTLRHTVNLRIAISISAKLIMREGDSLSSKNCNFAR
ncbi:hypothetical protein M514_07359 [Trichuris suis]|uniref:Uncharacterized protein n=1 Tax=Trichuris suis TaxID=68888 RepID=A0A085NFX9_9BILA|nr:hypothetical protein M513_07359 [Trichuris suis]KFD68375.1 hypothetical protein M514_07359 [Trichuris suis]